MAKKKVEEQVVVEEDIQSRIFDTPLDFLIGDRFGKYAKYIIQERALPDVRDGLKPVQRRIIYAMLVNGNVPNKQYRKSATAAGFVIGHYHPHGDTSVYDAMVRMSQWWKQNMPLIDMQGNNGSIDDDPAAAMRYTEARLSPIAMELLRDIEKDTVNFAPNYDDTTEEPTVLPAKFPNLLVNGAEGISAGYSTSIPPHNLNEVCKATIMRIKNPSCSLEEIMEVLPGPDFPTGGIIQGKDQIKEALSTGSGGVQVVAKTRIEERKNCIALVIEEIPFGVVKKQLVFSIDKIRNDKEIDGIIEVRDETDRTGLRIVVEMKKDANTSAIINYLMKKTKLSVKYNYNLVVICDKKPIRVGVLPVLDYYVKHSIEVINRRTKFDLDKTQKRHHILSGMAKAISAIDELIRIVRSSHSKEEIKTRIEEAFDLDEPQAEAIVTIQLHRLNSVDVEVLNNECKELEKLEKELASIIDNDKKIRSIIVKELEEIIKKYPTPRLSTIEDEASEYTIEKKPIVKEECMISITRDGYFKRSSLKSYGASNDLLPGIKNGDIIVACGQANTGDTLLCFTELGNFMYIPVFELFENKWKDEGKHINNVVSLAGNDKILKVVLVKEFIDKACVILLSKNGFIKKTLLKEFVLQRYNKPSQAMKLADNDKIVGVGISDGDSSLIVASSKGKVVQYHESKVSLVGCRAAGVIAMKKDELEGDELASLVVLNKSVKNNCVLLTNKGGFKIYNPTSIPMTNRVVKPIELYKFYRTEPHYLVGSLVLKDNMKIMGLTNMSIRNLEFDNKATPIGKTVKNVLLTQNKDEVFKVVSDMSLDVIDSSFKTYEYVEEVKTVKAPKVEEDDHKTLTIFDLLGDFDD